MDVIKSATTEYFKSSQTLAKRNKEPLGVGGVDILPLDAVRALLSSLTRIWRWRNTLIASSVVASINIDNYGMSTDHWRSMLHMHVHAFIHSRVDYCNAILLGVRDGVMSKLQSVLHAAARLVTGVRRPEWAYHADPSWCDPLAVSQAADHIQDCNNGFYLCSWYVPGVFLCGLYASSVTGRAKLRSAHHGHLIVPATKTKTFGSRRFRSAAPTVWNSLLSRHQHKFRTICRWTKNLVAWMCLHVIGATENNIVAAPHKCTDWLINWLIEYL